MKISKLNGKFVDLELRDLGLHRMVAETGDVRLDTSIFQQKAGVKAEIFEFISYNIYFYVFMLKKGTGNELNPGRNLTL
jgi:hypothetical protein